MKQRPIWIYPLIFIILHAGSHLSLLTYFNAGVSDFYLPTTMSIILLNWVGVRYVVPIVFLNSVVTSHLWGNPVESWPLWFVFAIPETIYPLLSYLLFNKLNKGKFWLPDTDNMLRFMVAGIMIPAIAESFSLQSLLILFEKQAPETFWPYVGSNILGEFTATFFITLPLLYYGSPWIKNKIHLPAGTIRQIEDHPLSRKEVPHLLIGVVILTAVVFLFDFKTYWYLYGLIPLYFSVSCGFGCVVIINLYILVLIYILPRIFGSFGLNRVENYGETINIFLGANFVFVFAAITGRIFDDLRIASNSLLRKNKSLKATIQNLQQTNQELDHFVYSVSHDLTAPLKSIEGVINISKLDKDHQKSDTYFGLISKSVKKLEHFIGEILDYSQNKNKPSQVQKIHFKQLCDDIIAELLPAFNDTVANVTYNLQTDTVVLDSIRLRIILSNIIHNAFRFQRTAATHVPALNISLAEDSHSYTIIVADNGEGIPREVLPHIFNMFYRGNVRSNGSGLGLYNARLAAEKLGGTIEISSELDKGTRCQIKVPKTESGLKI